MSRRPSAEEYHERALELMERDPDEYPDTDEGYEAAHQAAIDEWDEAEIARAEAAAEDREPPHGWEP